MLKSIMRENPMHILLNSNSFQFVLGRSCAGRVGRRWVPGYEGLCRIVGEVYCLHIMQAPTVVP